MEHEGGPAPLAPDTPETVAEATLSSTPQLDAGARERVRRSDEARLSPPAIETRESPALVVEVVDGSGQLVGSGTLTLTAPAGLNGGARIEGPVKGPWQLGRRALVDANPIEFPARDGDLEGATLRLNAFAEGHGSAQPVHVDPSPANATDAPHTVRLVLPAPRSLALEVLVEGSAEAVQGALVVATSELERRGLRPNGAATAIDHRFVTTTDAVGRCRLHGLGAGRLELEVHCEGYRPGQVLLRNLDELAQVYLVPDAHDASIEVTVLSPTGAPIEGAGVHCERGSISGAFEAVTDVTGRASFEELPAGFWMVSIDPERFAADNAREAWSGAAVERRVHLLSGHAEAVTLGFPRGDAAWRLEFVDAGGLPVRGLVVTITKESERRGRTDGRGVVLFEDLEPGAWRLSFDGGWEPAAHLVAARETLRTRLVVGERTIRGRVSFEDGSLVAGASLAFGDLYTASLMTDAEGRFEATGAPPAEYVVHVHKHGHPGLTTRLVVEPAMDPPPLDLVLPAGGRLRVHAPGADERKLRLRAVAASGKRSWLSRDATGLDVFESGPLAVGAYALEVRDRGAVVFTSPEPAHVMAGETVDVSLELPR